MGNCFLGRTIALAVAFGVLASGRAWASESEALSVEKVDASAAKPASYTTEILIAHAAPLGAMWTVAIVGDAKNDGAYLTPFGLTLAPVILAPPVVHAWHGNWGRSAASFGINLVAAVPGWATMWSSIGSPCEEVGRECDYRIFKKAAAVHTVFSGLVTLADVIMADVEPKSRRHDARSSFVEPGLNPVPGGLMLGAQGVF